MSAAPLTISDPLEILFKPARIGGVDLPNRIAMAPMTRAMSPGGVPGENVARYYRRRAEGGVGLIITEGTFIPHPSWQTWSPYSPSGFAFTSRLF